MEAVDDRSIVVLGNRGISLKEAAALALLFFSLQFTVLALGPGDPGAGVPVAWNSLLANAMAALGVVLAGWLVSAERFFTGGPGGVGMVRLSARGACTWGLTGALLAGVVLASLPFFDTGREPNPLMGSAYLEGSLPILLAWMGSLVVVAPIGEEMVCRGFILPALAGRVGNIAAIVGAALLFLAAHLPQIDGSWSAAAGIFSLGVLAGAARVRTGSLFGAMAVHASYNATILVYMLWARFVA